MIWASVPLAIAFLLLFGTAFYVGGNLYLACVAAFLVTVTTGFLYAMLTAIIPRSGGDYTWISRTLSPPLGFMSNLSWNFWITFFVGLYAAYTTAYGLSPLLRLWAARTGSPPPPSAANYPHTRRGGRLLGAGVGRFFGGLRWLWPGGRPLPLTPRRRPRRVGRWGLLRCPLA